MRSLLWLLLIFPLRFHRVIEFYSDRIKEFLGKPPDGYEDMMKMVAEGMAREIGEIKNEKMLEGLDLRIDDWIVE